MDDTEVDAVDVCLPHDLHARVATEAAQAGKHGLCEKPLAPTLAEADRMIGAAEKAGVLLMIAENVRFDPLFLKVRDGLREGVIGEPALVKMTREAYLTQDLSTDRPWFLEAKAAGGGVMMSGGVHDLEKMRMLIGEIRSVSALRARQRFTQMEGDDTSVATVRFEGGAVGTLVESFVMKSLQTPRGSEVHTLRIDADLGSLSVRDGETILLFSEREDLLLGGMPTLHEIYVPEADTFVLEIEHFLDSIGTGGEPLTSGRLQRRALEIALAAYNSMESGGCPLKLA